MKKWSKEEALDVIDQSINQIKIIKQKGRNSTEHMRWLANTLRILEEVFGKKSRYYRTLSSFSWKHDGSMILHGWDFDDMISEKHTQGFYQQLNQAQGLLLSAKDHLNESEIQEVYEDDKEITSANELVTIINLGEKKLRKLIRETPLKEKEVQDKFEDLLIASDIEYAKEFPHIQYSSKQYIPDFSFEKLNLAVEIKLCKTDEKSLIAQLNDDILAYRTKFKIILFIIYDLGNIRDIDTFKHSFDNYDDVIIQVVKH
jgi:DNA-binding protein YbaB